MEKSLSIFNDREDQLKEAIKPADYELFHSSNLDVLSTLAPIDFCSKEHVHDNYEFFIPLSFSPQLITLNIDQTLITLRAGMVIPCNPGQPHGTNGAFTIYSSLCLFVRSAAIQNIAYTTTGIKEVIFTNEGSPFNFHLQQLINRFIREARSQKAGHRYLLESLSTQIIIELLRSNNSNIKQRMQRIETGSRVNILKVVEYLSSNFDQKLTNTELLKIANLSPYYFIRLFKKETGKTPHEYLIHLKIEKAKELLTFTDYAITEICFLCGFSDHSHFSKVFKKLIGTSPLQYRQEQAKLLTH